MTTFAEMTDSILLHLHGLGTVQEQATYLSAGIDASATTFTVGDATAISRGAVEIGDELLWVDTVDTTTNTVTVAPYGRGFRSTAAAAHSLNERIAVPVVPRAVVKNAVNETIRAVFPDLWGVGTTTFTYVPGTYSYELPAGSTGVLQVQWQDVQTASEWINVRRFDMNPNADTTVFPTGASLTLGDVIVPGRTVRVVYMKQPTVLSATSDVFTTVTGLPASCEDVIRLGASLRLLPFFDAAHLSGNSAEADFTNNTRPVGGASNLARYFLQNYQLRLEQESARLNQLYPVLVRYSV